MSNPDPSGNIYLTAKAGMVAESRLKSADMVSQILMAWYSVCIIALSLLDLTQAYHIRDVSVMTAILSIAVLATSIFLPAQNFAIRAARFRECYLLLQQIYWSATTPEEKTEAYASTLPLFENHLQRDYEWVLFQSCLFGKPLADPKGAVVVSKLVIAKCVVRAVRRSVVILTLFIFPLVFGYMMVLPRQG